MRRASLAGLLVGAGLAAAAAQDEGFGFMPAGGRTLLLDMLSDPGAPPLAEVAALERDADSWRSWAAAQATDMDQTALDTLARYAALNLPLAAGAEAADLPPDGKDLAIAQCQFCHSLFSGYLMHDRDEVGWMGVFKSPFHSEIPMSPVERETFASYSALNMPLRFEDVPPELRF